MKESIVRVKAAGGMLDIFFEDDKALGRWIAKYEFNRVLNMIGLGEVIPYEPVHVNLGREVIIPWEHFEAMTEIRIETLERTHSADEVDAAVKNYLDWMFEQTFEISEGGE